MKLVAFSLLLPIILFGSAGRADWLMGWLYVALAFAFTLATRRLIRRVDPGLLAERASGFDRAAVKKHEAVFLPLLLGVCPLASWVIAGLSHRYEGWAPHASAELQWAAVAIVVLGNLIMSWAMVANRFFSSVVRIQDDRGHVVVNTGPYRFVRHPGYLGAVLINVGTPLMLDALWAFIPAAVVVVALAVRVVLEERTLRADLAGYAEYARETRFRIVPGLW